MSSNSKLHPDPAREHTRTTTITKAEMSLAVPRPIERRLKQINTLRCYFHFLRIKFLRGHPHQHQLIQARCTLKCFCVAEVSVFCFYISVNLILHRYSYLFQNFKALLLYHIRLKLLFIMISIFHLSSNFITKMKEIIHSSQFSLSNQFISAF